MSLDLRLIGRFETGIFDESAAEIVAYSPDTFRLYVVNGNDNTIDVLDITDPTNPTRINQIAADNPNSVAYADGVIAIASANDDEDADGSVLLYNENGDLLNTVTVGNLPDSLTFTPDGTKILVANEGEPGDTAFDPLGSISIIDLSAGAASATVTTLDFTGFDGQLAELQAAGLRIFPGNTVSQDVEPEFIAVSPDGNFAFVTLQENNAFAVVDIANQEITDILPLGTKDHSIEGNGFDASDRDDAINITTHPVLGLYMPDSVSSFEIEGETFYITANEGDARDEDARVEDLTLDPTAFPNAAELQTDENLGRLEVSTIDGDFDGDGDYDALYSYGSRSFTIWNSEGEIVFDSGDQLEQITAELFPEDFNSSNDDNDDFDSRSDAKGPEPEGVTVGVIDGQTFAFVGLERIGGVIVYNVSNPEAPVFEDYINTRDFAEDAETSAGGDLGPEGLTFISAEDSPNGVPLLAVGNEVSGSTAIYELDFTPEPFTLQILHASDLEGGVEAIGDAPNFAAIVDTLEDEYANTLILSAGDNFLSGPFFNAAGDFLLRDDLQQAYQNLFDEAGLTNIREGGGRVDISIMNIIGFEASALGNHEFDLGTDALAGIIGTDIRGDEFGDVRWLGAQFPYLSANLDFTNDGSLSGLFTSDILLNTEFQSSLDDLAAAAAAPRIAPATIIEEGGEQIGVIGATTQLLSAISSPGDTEVVGPDENDIPALAAILQPVIDQLTAQGVNKIILVSHLQQIALEQELATLLEGVDVIIAGGSDTLLADDTDRLRTGDVAADTYPVETTDANGNPVLIVSTDGEYSYVGRLVLEFDTEGNVIVDSVDENVSGAYATDDQGVLDVTGEATIEDAIANSEKASEVQNLTDAVSEIVIARDGDIAGRTDFFLEGRREAVRTEETNLGNLTADANIAAVKDIDPTVVVSIKNGGGIRAAIGEIDGTTGDLLPPQGNGLAGKEAGEVSQLDIENALRFNNQLTLVTLSAADLLAIVEHGVSATAEGATPGQFPQVGGLSFSFDPSLPAGNRVENLAVIDDNGNVIDVIVQNGELIGNAERDFRVVTLNFLAGGGDSYPFPALAEDIVETGIGEQQALYDFLNENFSETPFNAEETAPVNDTRIQNLSVEGLEDSVIPADFQAGDEGNNTLRGTNNNDDVIQGGAGDDQIFGFRGNDILLGQEGNDRIISHDGDDIIRGGEGDDTLLAHRGNDKVFGDEGNDRIWGNEGDDYIEGGAGDDRVDGGSGDDTLYGGEGNDNVLGLSGNDTAYGGAGDDNIEGGKGDDNLYGGLGNDEIDGGKGDDTISGGEGNDEISGKDGDDTIYGGDGNDDISAGKGDDIVDGGAGNDIINGFLGDDIISGGAGIDFITGGTGSDTFVFTQESDIDIIEDFNRRQDTLDLTDFEFETLDDAKSFASQVGDNVVFEFDAETTLVLEDVELDELNTSNVLIEGDTII